MKNICPKRCKYINFTYAGKFYCNNFKVYLKEKGLEFRTYRYTECKKIRNWIKLIRIFTGI